MIFVRRERLLIKAAQNHSNSERGRIAGEWSAQPKYAGDDHEKDFARTCCRHIGYSFPFSGGACRIAMTIPTSSVLGGSSSGAFLKPHRLRGHRGCGRWLTENTRTERRRMDTRQHATPPCRHLLGAGT